jgi:hypothetical protein
MRIPAVFFTVFFQFIAAIGVCLGVEGAPAARILPQSFAGWHASKVSQISKDPGAADPANSALLKEYGFTDFEGATYTREDGHTLTIKAARFQDASGAYGAFTFYKMPQMLNEKIGDQASSLNERVLFYRGNILVDAVFDRLSAMSAAELRELSSLLPRPPNAGGNLPGLPAYLPKESYVKNTAKYVVGPIALERVGALLPPQYVDFSKGAEVALGEYTASGGEASLMLVSYPTPQIAAAQFKEIESAQRENKLADFAIRRTGPILVLASGSISPSDAQSLVSLVNYEADVTWNEKTPSRRDNAANLIVGVILLAAIVCGLSIVAGVAFGGFRIAIKRLLPGKVFDRPDQMEIIALHLSDRSERAPDSGVSSSIKAG